MITQSNGNAITLVSTVHVFLIHLHGGVSEKLYSSGLKFGGKLNLEQKLSFAGETLGLPLCCICVIVET